jgi:hypothetical protein
MPAPRVIGKGACPTNTPEPDEKGTRHSRRPTIERDIHESMATTLLERAGEDSVWLEQERIRLAIPPGAMEQARRRAALKVERAELRTTLQSICLSHPTASDEEVASIAGCEVVEVSKRRQLIHRDLGLRPSGAPLADEPIPSGVHLSRLAEALELWAPQGIVKEFEELLERYPGAGDEGLALHLHRTPGEVAIVRAYVIRWRRSAPRGSA